MENKQEKGTAKALLIVLLIIAVLSVISAVLFFTLLRKPVADRHVKLGQKYLEEMRYDDAIAEFEKAVKIDPKNTDAYIYLSDAYSKVGDYEKAAVVLYTGVEKTGDEEIVELYDEIMVEYEDEVCAVTEDGVIEHNYGEAEGDHGPICEECGHEDHSRRPNYLDNNDIPYYDVYQDSYPISYLNYSLVGDTTTYDSEMYVNVYVRHNDDGTKTYAIYTITSLDQGAWYTSNYCNLLLADFFTGRYLNGTDTSGDESYDRVTNLEFDGREIEIKTHTEITWDAKYWIFDTYGVRADYIVECPEDYDGLILVSRKPIRFIDDAERETTSDTFIDEEIVGRAQLEDIRKAGSVVRIIDEYESPTYSKFLEENDGFDPFDIEDWKEGLQDLEEGLLEPDDTE